MIFTPFHDGIRKIPQTKNVYLTFDDGPESRGTNEVLERLARSQTTATFFVIAEKAQKNVSLLREIQKAGHKIGNHSWDHDYAAFLTSESKLKAWVLKSEDHLTQLLGEKPVGFRPPAGIVTPPLVKVLRELRLPMYLWSHRFFDTKIKFRPWLAKTSSKSLSGGEIVLLHDVQKPGSLPIFLKTLEIYIEEIKNRGYSLVHI